MNERESILNGMEMAGQTVDKSSTRNCSRYSRTSRQVMYGQHYKLIGNCIRRNTITTEILKMRTQWLKKKNVRRVKR